MQSKLYLALIAGLALAGCHDNTPPPPRVPVPAADNRTILRQGEYPKPLPPQAPPDEMGAAGGFNDEPLVNQRPPEQRAFVDIYNRVGRPRILIFVNRTLEGAILPVNPQPAEAYLKPGQYDEASAKSLDYQAMENILTDWIASNGQVMVISPTMARQKLTDRQLADLQSGRPRMLGEVAKELDADVLIQVQAHPTKQTPSGLEVRLVAEALNTRDGQSIGRAVVDVPPPLEKVQLNTYTRYVARKLMDDMIGSWTAPMPATQPAK